MTTWSEFKKITQYPKLSRDTTADVVIIGGGITGVLCAYLLSEAGKKVVLLEEEELGAGATLATTAFITKVIDTDLSELIDIWGRESAKQVFESGQAAVDELERIISKEKISAEFMRCDNFIFASTKEQAEDLRREGEAYRELGIPAHFGQAGELGFENYGHIRIPGQAKFHVAKFVYGLAEKAVRNGARIFEHTPVHKIKKETKILETPGGRVAAEDIIIATYKPILNEKTHLKKGMYASYVFEIEILPASFAEAIYEDCGNPYYYFRVDRQPDRERDRMILGGEDHKDIFGKKLAEKSFQALERYTQKLLAGHSYRVVKKWQGPILEPSDGLPLIGEINPHLYIATAFSGNGMTYATISALLLRDLILGRKNPWSDIYDPKRTIFHPKRLASKTKDYTEEFFHGAWKNLLQK